uniref:Neuronal tyrosine phosphorylated phosphoinositide-3-kinase adaptor 1 n=1 Tax=Cynoglossus semilaevis TaxID=244447 RepID=A0A3P8WKH0_CYNSE
MNLLYRKSRLDWRQRDQEGRQIYFKILITDRVQAERGSVRDLASFRRHFRMGFMTMPASQDLSPHTCASAMAPRSQSCHAVGAGDTGLENGDYSDTQSQHGGRCPPAKPKRHPSTRLSSSSSDGRGPPDSMPPPPPSHSQSKHSEKKNSMKKSDSGDVGSKKVPPLKPKRSPSTQLTFDPLPPRVPHSSTSLPFHAADSQIQTGEGDDEPVYIEMVGQVFTRESQTATPHPVTPVATTPDSDSDQSEAIYEEMKYPLQENRESHRHLPHKQDKLKSSKHFHVTPSSSSVTNTKIPAPFPNLLQHRPPLLAFPQPAAASSGVGSSSAGGAQQDKHSRELGPAPGLRARSHSTPLPPSSKSTSPYSHHHHHPHHRPSHYHHYRKPDRGDSPAPTKSSSQTSTQATVQTQTSGSGREGKSVKEDGRAWNGSADALLRMDKEELGLGSRGGPSGIPVHFGGASSRALGHTESLAGADSGLGFRALPRVGLPLPCQTFPACRNGEVGRLGRSSSAAGGRQVGGGDVQRQSSLPAREALSQPTMGGGAAPSTTQTQRDGKLLEVIERKRCLCKEIKAHRRPDKSLCKQDSMPILPSWRRTPEPRKAGTPPCQRPQAVVWDTAI